jgi:NAD(P)H-dependent FMN reductase
MRILAISGSLRLASSNTALLRAALAAFAGAIESGRAGAPSGR